jgi:hypothetical protein
MPARPSNRGTNHPEIGDFAHPFGHFPASEGSIPLAAKAASLNNDEGVSSVSQGL